MDSPRLTTLIDRMDTICSLVQCAWVGQWQELGYNNKYGRLHFKLFSAACNKAENYGCVTAWLERQFGSAAWGRMIRSNTIEDTRRRRWRGRVGSKCLRDTLACRRVPWRRPWRTSRRRRRRRWRGRTPLGCGSAATSRRCRRTAGTCPEWRSWAGSRPCWCARTTCTARSQGTICDTNTIRRDICK